MLRDIFDCHRFTTPLLRRDVKRTTYTARAATVSTHQNLPHDGRTARVRDEKKARDAIAGRAIDPFGSVGGGRRLALRALGSASRPIRLGPHSRRPMPP